jgi:hypothetical protein
MVLFMLRVFCISCTALTLLWTSFASAQDRPPSSFVSDVVKGVVFDPTTYAPAMVTYGATRLDWGSSQVFFQLGFAEHNARYTVSGVSDSAAVSRRAGNRRIAADSLGVLLKVSLVHNVTERVIERVLIRQYPNHQKLWRVVGLVERIVGASYLSIALSAKHVRQWQQNERLARQLGYK